MASEANEPGSESGKRSDDRRGAARRMRAGSRSPQEGGATSQLAARLPPRSPGSFAAADMTTRTASLGLPRQAGAQRGDRKSTRLNSSHMSISYAVFCLKKKNLTRQRLTRQPLTRQPITK